MLGKNQIIQVEITALTHQGEGVARYEGMAVFIPMTAIGDKLRAKVVKVLRSYAYGIVEELLEPSPHRMENDCPVYRRCGGCSLRHMQYGHELEVKSGWVADNLRRLGGIELSLDPILPSPCIQGYRNKAQYPVGTVEGKLRAGFFSKRSHTLVPAEDCLLQPPFFGDIIRIVLDFMERQGIPPYDESAHSGTVRHIYIRYAQATGQVMVCLVVNGKSLPQSHLLIESLKAIPGFTTLVVNSNRQRTNVILGKDAKVLCGPGYITDELCGIKVHISPQSFYQVNREGAEGLYRAALDYAAPSPGDILLDLYCGAGAIGLSMAHQVGEVIGVEVVPQAVEDAKGNAADNGIQNARFICADAGEAAGLLRREGVRPNIVVLDPPRKGVDEVLIRHVAEMAPDKVVYVSCNSATLARDCKAFLAHGYRTVKGRAADLFPRTPHVESVVLLVRDS